MPFWLSTLIFIAELILMVAALAIMLPQLGINLPYTKPIAKLHKPKPKPRLNVVSNNVLFIGTPGSGKTQSQIKVMLSEIEIGSTVVWLNPHYTLYHPEDQTTDLRPIKDRFKQVGDYIDIADSIKFNLAIVNERMVNYRNGNSVGKKMVLILDELPAIAQVCGKQTIANLTSIMREGRKVKVFVVAASQDALTETLSLKTGARNLFQTVYMSHNVDLVSWRAFSDLPKPADKLPLGQWYDRFGVIHKI